MAKCGMAELCLDSALCLGCAWSSLFCVGMAGMSLALDRLAIFGFA